MIGEAYMSFDSFHILLLGSETLQGQERVPATSYIEPKSVHR